MNGSIDWTSIFVQVPLVGIFIWFTLKMQSENQKTIDRLVSDNRSSSAQVMVDWRGYLQDRDNQWMQFLLEQRNSQNQTLDTFSQRLNDVSTVVRDLDQHVRANGLGKNGNT